MACWAVPLHHSAWNAGRGWKVKVPDLHRQRAAAAGDLRGAGRGCGPPASGWENSMLVGPEERKKFSIEVLTSKACSMVENNGSEGSLGLDLT